MGSRRAREAGGSPILGLQLLLGSMGLHGSCYGFPYLRAAGLGSVTLLPLSLSPGMLLGSCGSLTSYLTSQFSQPCISKSLDYCPSNPDQYKG